MKIRRMTIIPLLAALMASSLSGCNEWLEVKPDNEQSNAVFWANKEEVFGVVTGAYQQMRSALATLVQWGEVRSDEIELGPGWSSNTGMLEVRSLEIKPDNAICNWQPLYNCIGRCNSVMEYAPQVLEKDNTFTPETEAAYIAEVKWLRALCYFYLVRTFGDVPYVLRAWLYDDMPFEVPVTSGEEVLEAEIASVTEVLEDFPVSYGAGSWMDKGRATIWSAYALLADMYLWLGKYDDCITMCSKLEASHLFSLVENKEWYTIYYPGNSVEGIFELQWSEKYEQNNNLYAWFFNDSASNNYAISESAKQKFLEYPSEDDVRAAGGSYVDASSKIWKYAGTSHGGSSTRESSKRDANWIIYRFADILLMHAEALIMKGSEYYDEAYTYIVQIRERAGYLTHPVMPADESAALDFLLDERLRELCFEGKRWYDLVRIAVRDDGKYKSKLVYLLLLNVPAKDRPLYEIKLQDVHGYYLPIRENDIDASGGVLVQNPYYL